MNTKRLFRQTIRTFLKNWIAYITLVFTLNLILTFIIVPIMRWLTKVIMVQNSVPYVSYTNVGWLFTKRPLAVLELALLAIVILLLVFWQFAFLIQGIEGIHHNQERRLTRITLSALQAMRQLRVSSFIFFIPYFVLILPFSDMFFTSPLLSKIQLPDFILTFMESNALYLSLLVIAAVVVTYLGVRLIQVLPLTVLGTLHGARAVRTSWQMTRHHTWSYFWRLACLGALIVINLVAGSVLLYGLQLQLDKQSKTIAFIGAVANMALLSIWVKLVGAAVLAIFILMLIRIIEQSPSEVATPNLTTLKHPRGSRRVAALVVAIFLLGQGTYNVFYLRGAVLTKPLAISHRGVDAGNGVQNTIPALNKTSKEKPAYVEMDLHETKDHKFVVMHDENLKNLTGVNKQPYQLTLKQMTRLKARENGHVAHVASFDQYLKAAERDHQKLLVEIKVNKHDSANMMQLFMKRYKARLLRDHDWMHSLSYPVISYVVSHDPKETASFILPYNLTFPQTKADAYTMEQTTLNETFVNQAHANHQKVLAWTVDDEDDMTHMMFLNVDGIITDNLHELQTNIKTTFNHPSYARELLVYANELTTFTGNGGVEN